MMKLEKMIKTDTEAIYKFMTHVPSNGLFPKKKDRNLLEDVFMREKTRTSQKMHRMKKSTQAKTIRVIKDHENHVKNYKRTYAHFLNNK